MCQDETGVAGAFRWDWRACGAFCVCLSLAAAFALMPLVISAIGASNLRSLSEPVQLLFATTPLQVALLASALLPAALCFGNGTFLGRLALQLPSLKMLCFTLGVEALVFPTLLLVSALSSFAMKFANPGVDIQQMLVRQALETSNGGFAVLAFSAVMLAPLAEELAFRRVVFSFLQSFAGTFPAMVTTSAIFAASHCSLSQAPSLFLLVLALQWTCLRWNSTTPAILLHCLHNAISMSLILLMRVSGIQL